MTVKELKKELKNLPDNMFVFIRQTNDEYELSQVEKVEPKVVSFGDGTALRGKDRVLVLTDEF